MEITEFFRSPNRWDALSIDELLGWERYYGESISEILPEI